MRRNDQLRKRIQSDVEAFLKRGGKITIVPDGVSGEADNAPKFNLSEYDKKIQTIEKNSGKPFWQFVSEFADKGYTQAEVASSIGMRPGEFIYMVKKSDKGHLWPTGTSC